VRGIGLGAAIAINICGAAAVAGWLLCGHLDIPVRGRAALWVMAILVLAIGFAEALGLLRKADS
jgi:hypothetical protein